jgi:ubiquinol-cytochrome c reductase cytochrome c subunit
MKNICFVVATVLALLLVTVTGSSAQQAPAGDAAKGKATFLRVGCYECHGTVGQGGTGPRLAPNPRTVESLTTYVRKPAGMPAYSAKVLLDAELADIRAYLASLPAPPSVASIPLLNQ